MSKLKLTRQKELSINHRSVIDLILSFCSNYRFLLSLLPFLLEFNNSRTKTFH